MSVLPNLEQSKFCSCSATLMNYPTVDDRCESNLKSGGRLKQELKYTFGGFLIFIINNNCLNILFNS